MTKIYAGSIPLDGLGYDFGKSICKQILKLLSPDSFNKGLVPMLQGGLPGSIRVFKLMDPKGMMGGAKRFNNQVNTLSWSFPDHNSAKVTVTE